MKTKLILFSLLSVFLFATCKKDTPAGPSGPAGPSLTGDIIGYVYLSDVNGNKVTDNSGIAISVEGTAFATNTAKDGRFVLSQVTTGTYSILFSKAGYGTRKAISYKFIGGGQDFLGTYYMNATPLYTVSGISATSNPNNIAISGTINAPLPTGATRVRFFADTTAAVSSDPKHYIFSVSYGSGTPPVSALSFNISKQTITSSGISSGQTLYLVAYPDGLGSYTDINTGKTIYSNLNPTPSNTISIIVP